MGQPKVKNQGGFSLIELVLVIVIIGILSVGMISGLAQRADAQQQSIAATHMKTYADAAYVYIQNNAAAIQAGAGPSTPVTISAAQLHAAGVLDASVSDVSPYGQVLTVRVLEPTAGKLEPIILSTGGSVLTDRQVHGIAQKLTEQGGDGGFIDSRNAGMVVGAGGWWRKDASSYGVSPGIGHVADGLFVRLSATTDDYLHRTANTNPALNAMSTDINMQGHSLNSVGTLNANLIKLPGGNSINIGGSFLYGDGNNLALRPYGGDVYFQRSSGAGNSSIATIHNINGDSTSTFSAQTISAFGNITSAGSVTAGGNVTAAGAAFASNWFRSYGNTGWHSETYGGGWYMQDTTWLRSYADKSIYTGGNVEASAFIPTGRASPNSGCATWGAIATSSDGSGATISCEAGVWKKLSGGYSDFRIVNGPLVASNWSYATCPSGYTLLSGGGIIPSNPYGTMPGYESQPINTSTWGVASTDSRVAMYAVAYCAR